MANKAGARKDPQIKTELLFTHAAFITQQLS
jgi:hypothetical protein